MRVQWLVIETVTDAIAGNGGTISEVIVAILTRLCYQMQLLYSSHQLYDINLYDINTDLDESFANHLQDFHF